MGGECLSMSRSRRLRILIEWLLLFQSNLNVLSSAKFIAVLGANIAGRVASSNYVPFFNLVARVQVRF